MTSKPYFFALIAIFFGVVCFGAGYGQSRKSDPGENAARMQSFVKDISRYARTINPNFIIIPQNGAELAFNNAEPDKGVMASYVAAIDGIGIEELFYNGSLKIDRERLAMLRELKNSVTIMVSDFVSKDANLFDAVQRNINEGFIAFPRSSKNYDYKLIPGGSPTDVNTDTITSLTKAKNYLYLISTDEYKNKEDMITAIKVTNYDVVLIDLFFDGIPFTQDEVQQLKTKANGGTRLVICYVSIGSAEEYRYYWQPGWKKGNPPWLKKNYEGYPDEFWVEYWNPEWQDIIFSNDGSYIKKIMNAGFDGAYLDNVEAYYFLGK